MTYQQITQQTAKELIETNQNITILDVRTPEEFKKKHIKGAVCLPNEQLQGAPSSLPDKAQPILVYCRSGIRSKDAAQKLANMNYEHVLEFGGIIHWPYPEMLE